MYQYESLVVSPLAPLNVMDLCILFVLTPSCLHFITYITSFFRGQKMSQFLYSSI